jgi:hypothetical protein
MGRMYTATVDAISVSAAKDLLRISAPSDAIVRLWEVRITQDASETSEQLPFQIHRGNSDGTGTSLTLRPTSPGDAAFGGTAVYDLSADTTVDHVLVREGINVLTGFQWAPTMEGGVLVAAPSGRLVVRLDAAPTAALTFNVWALVEELG